MKLFVDSGYLSPWALSSFAALTVKGAAFTLETVDLSVPRPAEYAAKSLTGLIPLLEDGDFTLIESMAITGYIDETVPGPALYPQDARQRAQARQVQSWIRSSLQPLRKERPTEAVFLGHTFAPLSAEAEACARQFLQVASRLLSHGGATLTATWSLADIDLALMINRLRLHGDTPGDAPLPDRLTAYAAEQWQHPAVQAWLALPRPV